MSELRMRRRARLKSKQSKALKASLVDVYGELLLWEDAQAVETAEFGEQPVFIVDQVVLGIGTLEDPFLSVRGLLKYRPTTRYATVDMGAVRFVHNGADIMAPGITEADPELEAGDWCWIRDEKNGQPLAVGRCVMSGPDMAAENKGKAIQNVHHIGDKLWDLDS